MSDTFLPRKLNSIFLLYLKLPVNPKHSISFCPVCGGGLCGIRVCDGPAQATVSHTISMIDDDPMCDPPSRHSANQVSSNQHGLVVCDECEAIWLSPDTETDHLYPDPENSRCPICHDALWGQSSHWASMQEIGELGWEHAVDSKLDYSSDEGVA